MPRPVRVTNPFASRADRQQPPKHGPFIRHLFAFDELSDFDPDIGEHLEEAGIGWPDFRGKEFNDAQKSLRSLDGKSKRGMQVRFPGEFEAREIPVLDDIRNPAGFAASEDSHWQSYPGRKSRQQTLQEKPIEALPL